jgi:hypothetical protein
MPSWPASYDPYAARGVIIDSLSAVAELSAIGEFTDSEPSSSSYCHDDAVDGFGDNTAVSPLSARTVR